MSGVAGRKINQPAVDGRADPPQRPRGCRDLECRELHGLYILLRGVVCCPQHGGTKTREKMHFSVGCVSGLCGDASSSPAAKRPGAREHATRIQDGQRSTSCIYVCVFSRPAFGQRTRCVARVSVLNSSSFSLIVLASGGRGYRVVNRRPVPRSVIAIALCSTWTSCTPAKPEGISARKIV